jgi:hypothetical protein
MSAPYSVSVTIQGVCPLLFHRWNVEAVAAKAAARKGSQQKKTDDVESYVYRDDKDYICIPGEYVRQSLIGAARYMQDPRSPRKSAVDLFKAGIVSKTELASLGTKKWDYLDQRRVQVQRNALTRVRPAFHSGWQASFDFTILLPEYITREVLQDAFVKAGALVGIGDMRPTYGRFVVIRFVVHGEKT